MLGIETIYDWKAGRPTLAAWYDAAVQRPSVQWFYGRDYEGDVSVENLRAHVADALRARG